ncbi:MAG: hypothetical protein AB202_02320 [Parcubacteria bacterium C7867-007]|nr:MAG: hypothetical protein AB202_02320 [Parcubacteria bacterium C7867-007]
MSAFSLTVRWVIFILLAFAIAIGYSALQEASEESDVLEEFNNAFVSEEISTSTVRYVEVTAGCDAYFQGGCVNVRAAPTTTAPVLEKLRSGVVLAVAATTTIDSTGREWNKVVFSEWLRYPERMQRDWYVATDGTNSFLSEQAQELSDDVVPATTKRIRIDRSEQMLYAYDGDELFLDTQVSTGLDLTPTPRGNFIVYRKTPSRYMQGPLPSISDQYYDLPGVPWNLYFTEEGGAIHGTYWHDMFGKQRSHGCVNLPPDVAKALYEWTPLGTPVLVQD